MGTILCMNPHDADAVLLPIPELDRKGREIPTRRLVALGAGGLLIRDDKGRDWVHARDDVREVVFSQTPPMGAHGARGRMATVMDHGGHPFTTLATREWARADIEAWAEQGGLPWRDAQEGEPLRLTSEAPLLHPSTRRGLAVTAFTLGVVVVVVLLLAVGAALLARA